MQSQNRPERKSHTVLIVEPDEATRRILDQPAQCGLCGGRRQWQCGSRHQAGADSRPVDCQRRRGRARPLSSGEASNGRSAPGCRAHFGPRCRQQATRPGSGRRRFRRPSHLRSRSGGARPCAPAATRARAYRARRPTQRAIFELRRRRSPRRPPAGHRSQSKIRCGDAARRRRHARRDFFRQGRVVDAEVGRLSGRDAVYRLFCWPAGRLDVDWKSIRRKDTIETAPQDLIMEALRRVDEWRRLLTNVPQVDTVLEVDYRLLAERLADIPDEANRILRLFDGMRTVMQVIDDCGLPDLDAVAAIGKLCRDRIVHDVRVPVEEEPNVGAEMEGWLTEAAGPFRSSQRMERELFLGSGGGMRGPGRLTAPLEPLGESAREAAVDAEMQVRFTDCLRAEAPPEPVAFLDAPGEPRRSARRASKCPPWIRGQPTGARGPRHCPVSAAPTTSPLRRNWIAPRRRCNRRRLSRPERLRCAWARTTSRRFRVDPESPRGKFSSSHRRQTVGPAGAARAAQRRAPSTRCQRTRLSVPRCRSRPRTTTARLRLEFGPRSRPPRRAARGPSTSHRRSPKNRPGRRPLSRWSRGSRRSDCSRHRLPWSSTMTTRSTRSTSRRLRVAWPGSGCWRSSRLVAGALLARNRLADRSMAIPRSEPSVPAAPRPGTTQVEPLGAAPAGTAAAPAATPVPDRGYCGDSKLLPATALSPRDDGRRAERRSEAGARARCRGGAAAGRLPARVRMRGA